MSDRSDLEPLGADAALLLAAADPRAWAGRIAVLSAPVSREQVTVPISRHAPPDDAALFDDPADPARKYWLPRYRLAEETVAGQQRYRIGFRERDGQAVLALRLDAAPPPGLQEAASTHAPLDHGLEIELSFAVLGAPRSRKAMRFQEVLRDADAVDATLLLSGLAERDEVFGALGDAAREARLTVRRTATVALEERIETAPAAGGTEAGQVLMPINRMPIGRVPLEPVRPIRPVRPIPIHPIPIHPIPIHPIEPVRPPSLPDPQIDFAGAERITSNNRNFVRYLVAVRNWRQFAPEFLAAAPSLPPCGANRNAGRSWIDLFDPATNRNLKRFCGALKPETLARLWFATPAGAAPPQTVQLRITDRLKNETRLSNVVAVKRAPPQILWRVTEAAIEQGAGPEPFAFSASLHSYVFAGLGGGGGGAPGSAGLIRHRESFGGAVHSYFQDAAQPELIYHLPDGFRIARRGGGFRAPLMTLRVRTENGSAINAEATLDYVVAPVIDPARLEAARRPLASRAHLDPTALVFQPYSTGALRLFAERPAAAGRVEEERPAGQRMLEGPVWDTLAMPLADFQLVFDAMLGRTASRFGGRVEIEIDGWESESRPFEGSFSKLAGPALDVGVAAAGDSLGVTLRNAIESPVELGTLGFLASDGLTATALESAAPVASLAPGEETSLTLPHPAPGSEVMLTVTRGVTVKPEDAAVLDAILDRSTLEYFRDITVKTVPSIFTRPTTRPEGRIIAILVDFEGGETVELTLTSPTAIARVDYPFDNVILRRPVSARYRYRKTVIRESGPPESDPEPIENDATIIFLHVPD